jgi:hypothetical protein
VPVVACGGDGRGSPPTLPGDAATSHTLGADGAARARALERGHTADERAALDELHAATLSPCARRGAGGGDRARREAIGRRLHRDRPGLLAAVADKVASELLRFDSPSSCSRSAR